MARLPTAQPPFFHALVLAPATNELSGKKRPMPYDMIITNLRSYPETGLFLKSWANQERWKDLRSHRDNLWKSPTVRLLQRTGWVYLLPVETCSTIQPSRLLSYSTPYSLRTTGEVDGYFYSRVGSLHPFLAFLLFPLFVSLQYCCFFLLVDSLWFSLVRRRWTVLPCLPNRMLDA